MPYIVEAQIESDEDLEPEERDRVAIYYIKMDKDVPELFEHLGLVVESFRHIVRGSYKRGIGGEEADYFSDFSDSEGSGDGIDALGISVEEERGQRFMGIVRSQVVRVDEAEGGRKESGGIESGSSFVDPVRVGSSPTPEEHGEHVMVESKVRPGVAVGVKRAGLSDKRQEMKLMENNLQTIFGSTPKEPEQEVSGHDDFDLDQLNISNSEFLVKNAATMLKKKWGQNYKGKAVKNDLNVDQSVLNSFVKNNDVNA